MTNSLNKMAGKNSAAGGERNGTGGKPRSSSKLRPLKGANNISYIQSVASPARKIVNIAQQPRLSPSSPPAPARTSPGLVAGYFAGGKWSEPPSPTTLPKPPQHWTQLMFASGCSATLGPINVTAPQTDLATHLKMLLNVHA